MFSQGELKPEIAGKTLKYGESGKMDFPIKHMVDHDIILLLLSARDPGHPTCG